MNNTRTATMPVTDDWVKGDTLLSSIDEFDGESRYWENVTVTAEADLRVALLAPGSTGEPTSEAASVSIAANASRTFASIDFEHAWFKTETGGDSGAESGAEDQGFEIVGTPASRPNTF